MKNKFSTRMIVIGIATLLTYSCMKDEITTTKKDAVIATVKKDPILTWFNPADIMYGTLLSATQLNAKADISGTFVYTPPIGTILKEGTNQNLDVAFSPTDTSAYNSIHKTVKINVTKAVGISSTIFNSNLTYGTVTDIDGNVYKTITIGTQTWMAENLRVTHYRNGEAIALVTDNTVWSSLSTGAYCNYNNTTNLNDIATYGSLYNWYAVSDSRNIAPEGWHISTDEEWYTLTAFVGGQTIAGGTLKEAGKTHWASPNNGATNESGFSALPSGARDGGFGPYIDQTHEGNYWSSTEKDATNAWIWTMTFDGYFDCSNSPGSKKFGFALRCVKD